MSHQVFRGASFDVAPVQRFSKRPSNTVIAIDLATTRSCLAIGQRLLLEDHNITPPDVKLYTCWTDAYEAGSKWPITAMLYNSQGVPSTGNDLEMAFKSRASRNFDMNKHFRQWKLLFHDDQSDVAIKRIQDELYSKLSLLEKTRLQLLQDWVKLIYTDLLKAQGNGLYSLNDSIGSFDKQDIEIVVTVPPGRSVLAHDEVHKAFIQGPIGKGQVFLVSEPEAMFRSWIHDGADSNDFKVGGRYMVVDGGGGTCCIVRFLLDQLEPSLGFEQEFESESMVCGAESISNLVEEKIEKKVPRDIPNRVWVLDQFRRQFDEYFKRRFGADDADTTYNFELPNLECELSRRDIAECFDICIEKLFKTMERHLSRGLPFLVLGGGLFASPYVMRAVEKRFSNLKICRLSADKGHVARGAVLVRACAPFIIRRPILRSKAVTTFVEVTDAIRKSLVFANLYIKKDRYKGEQWCLAAQWLAKQGTEADIKHANDMYEVASEATFADARKRFFDTDDEDLTFSDTILTFNHTPLENQELLYQLKDGSWATLDGFPLPESSEKLTWDPRKIGVNLNSLEISYDHKKTKPFRILRYAIQMQMREVGTKYWFKTWSWTKPPKTKGRVRQVLRSGDYERHALFAPQEISRNLAASYDLGPGLRRETKIDEEKFEIVDKSVQGFMGSAGSLSNQAHHVEASSSNALVTLAHQSATREQVHPRSSSLRPDLFSTRLAHCHERQTSYSPSRMGRSTEAQRREGNAKYSIGAPRNNGGCWTCSFRNLKCDAEKPRCIECANLGLVCEYGRPAWLFNEALEQAQREIHKRLIKEHKALLALGRQSLDRSRLPIPGHSSGTQNPQNTAPSNPAANPTVQNTSSAGPKTLVRRKAFHPRENPGTQREKLTTSRERYDIYDYPSPSPKRPRFSEPDPEEEVGGSADDWRRRSTRQREPTALPADMVSWKEIDAEEYEVESETADSE
ncbi:hypothetical protein L207DRAFT_588183 [Hyaloscypha variabilis F]|uniref:Zn(2)-C6 fungal-type domain-containing protein n=1 Tax=Hyaloscypha variabilis (strain UAMH 11265 / GT02V1 / F) TaxID=1149755 RepID=A0A2J6R823_HYAVF|nr:hypothetical protein L207DRAFT_588183 [Hyaloscypha variabilis F]